MTATIRTARPSQWTTWKALVDASPGDPVSAVILQVRAEMAVEELVAWLVGNGYDEIDFPGEYRLAQDLADIAEIDLEEALALARMG